MNTKHQKRGKWSRAAHRALGLAMPLVMLMTGCGGSLQRSDAGGGATGAPSMTSTAPSPVASPSPAALVELTPGYHVVNVVTGEHAPLPESITRIEGAANLEVSPDGSMLLFDTSGDQPRSDEPGLHQIYVANMDGSDVHQATHDRLGASFGSWSPDGSSIVFIGGVADLEGIRGPESNMSVLDLDTGELTALLTGPGPWYEEPRFASDGRSIMYSSCCSRQNRRIGHYGGWDLWTVPLEGGDPKMALTGRGFADLSPDGKSILYPRLIQDVYGRGSVAEVWISDGDGSDARVLVPATLDYLSAWPDAGWSPNGVWVGYTQSLPWSREQGAYFLNVLTGERTLVAFGESVDWLDHWKLIVRADAAI